MDNEFNLKRLNLLITKRCNLHCRMCDYRLTSFFVKELSFDRIISLIDEASDMGLKQLEISGGEPMLRERIYEIIAYAASIGLKTMMMTNGVLIGKEEAKRLVDSDLNGVVISLEGWEEMNDAIRGKGSYKKAVSAIGYLKEWEDRLDFIKVGVTISKHNYLSIFPFTKYLFEELGINAISYNPFNKDMLMKANFENRKNEFVMEADFSGSLKNQLEMIIEYSKKIKGEFPPENYLRKIPGYFEGVSMVPNRGCTQPLEGCTVDSGGSVYPCWGESVLMGNLNESALKDIVASERYVNHCSRVAAGKCKGCLSACYVDIH